MRYFTIGRLRDSRGHIRAYKIYNTDTEKMGLYEKEEIARYMKAGIKVNGFHKRNDGYVSESAGRYKTSILDDVDSNGNPKVENGTRVIINKHGFLEEDTLYLTINSKGEKEWLTHNETVQLYDENKIVGALRGNGGALCLHKQCKEEYRGEIQKIPQINS